MNPYDDVSDIPELSTFFPANEANKQVLPEQYSIPITIYSTPITLCNNCKMNIRSDAMRNHTKEKCEGWIRFNKDKKNN